MAHRRRQRRIRQPSILEVKEVLAVIGIWQPSGREAEQFAMEIEGINASIDKITHLRRWDLRRIAEGVEG